MGAHAKMRGRLKRVGRCDVPGHGQECSVTREIREAPVDRAQEKRETEREVEFDERDYLERYAALGDEKALHLLGRGPDPLGRLFADDEHGS